MEQAIKVLKERKSEIIKFIGECSLKQKSLQNELQELEAAIARLECEHVPTDFLDTEKQLLGRECTVTFGDKTFPAIMTAFTFEPGKGTAMEIIGYDLIETDEVVIESVMPESMNPENW
jgi:hypothetical protein